ncbi:TonB-dependent receptor [Sphingobacterium corticibacter]|uniref:Ferric aerobactin receptor n=1 Tax=Sphingobacterium corticibacter TaxID=2171749 RepID=A0A2T8HMI2_9SPHI|nr:TonB-dependent receptor [Sphingobacterium corticibacter]PVH26613.1 ferric aerobactin receptor [Sphingobacterium corticibacter]
MKIFFSVCRHTIILIALLSVSNELLAQILQVSVQDAATNPIENVQVWVDSRIQGKTDNQGVLAFNQPSRSQFQIRISKVGYSDQVRNVHIDTVSAPIEFTLGSGQQMEQIVVTAGRKPESIANVPSSISILNARDIEMQSQISTNIASVLGNTIPGLGTSTAKGSNAGQTLRGRAVLILIDGIPQSTPLMNGARDMRSVDPAVLERVEVIKGATSIYGNGSAGGVINYITKKNDPNAPRIGGTTTVRGTLAPGEASETGGYRFAQSLYGRSNKWNYAVSGVMDYTGLQRDGDGLPLGQTDGLSNNRQYNAFMKVGYDIDEKSDLTLVYNFFNSLQDARYISQIGTYGEEPTIGVRGTDPGANTGTRFNHNAMLSYRNAQIFGNTSLNAAAFINSFSSMNRYVEETPSWFGPGQTMINSNKKGLRVDLNTPFDLGSVPSEVTYGVDVLHDVTFQDLTDGRVFVPKMNMINYAPFAQLTLNLVDQLIFKGGIRYENANVKINDFSTLATGPNGEGSVAVQGGEVPYSAATFNAGLRYSKYALFNPFISFSQGFTINELGRIVRNATESDLTRIQTDPIVTNNYEAGFSSQWNNIHFSAAYFISTSKLGLSLVANDEGIFRSQRAPERIYGFEAAADIRITPQWTIGGTYSYVEGKIEAEDGTKTYLNGTRIMPPKATGYLDFQPRNDLSFQLSWVHTGSRARFERNANGVFRGNEGAVETIDLLNLNASYRMNKNWNLGLGVSNLLNKTYYTVYSQYGANAANYVRGEGALASLNLQYTF